MFFMNNIYTSIISGAIANSVLTITTLWAFSADDKLIMVYFSYFYKKIGFDISCKLSPYETICMKCILFSVKNKKNISKCHLLNILPSVKG